MDRFNSAVNCSLPSDGGIVHSHLFSTKESTSAFCDSGFPASKGHSCGMDGMLGLDYRMASGTNHFHVIQVWLLESEQRLAQFIAVDNLRK